VVIGLAADHHAVHLRQLVRDLRRGGDAAVDHDRQRREVGLEAVHELVAQAAVPRGSPSATGPSSQALRACTMNTVQPASATVPTKSRTKS
jgi:hypothetical protein